MKNLEKNSFPFFEHLSSSKHLSKIDENGNPKLPKSRKSVKNFKEAVWYQTTWTKNLNEGIHMEPNIFLYKIIVTWDTQ